MNLAHGATRVLSLSLSLSLFACGEASEPETDTTTTHAALVCGMHVSPSPTGIADDPCVSGRTIFGTETFSRTPGEPDTFSRDFTVGADQAACIRIASRPADRKNGPAVASADVAIDGKPLATPSEFSAHPIELRIEPGLAQGEHTLDVRIASAPGSSLDIEVLASGDEGRFAPQPVVTGDAGYLELTNVAIDHPMFTPNGDGHHDTTYFSADAIPQHPLPGEDSGDYTYYLEHDWTTISTESCDAIDTNVAGRTEINSPTNLTATWDGTDVDGNVLPDGKYIYFVEVRLVRSDGLLIDSATSPAFGLLIETEIPEYDGQPAIGDGCDSTTDPFACSCPPGSTDCASGLIKYLQTFEDPTFDTSSFLTTTYDDEMNRWRVHADLRQFNAGGLVPQMSGDWGSVAELREYVETLTGVPASSDERLFNFDYTQTGYSTAVEDNGLAGHSFNHLLLDVITDGDGKITIGGETTDVAALVNADSTVPDRYVITNGRQNDECTDGGNTDGTGTLKAKFCAVADGIRLKNATGEGLYVLWSSTYDVEIDGATTTRDPYCIINGVLACGFKTTYVNADIEVQSQYYYAGADGPVTAFQTDHVFEDTPAAVIAIDRLDDSNGGVHVLDGICSRAFLDGGGLSIRLDSADGIVPSTCIINGVL